MGYGMEMGCHSDIQDIQDIHTVPEVTCTIVFTNYLTTVTSSR